MFKEELDKEFKRFPSSAKYDAMNKSFLVEFERFFNTLPEEDFATQEGVLRIMDKRKTEQDRIIQEAHRIIQEEEQKLLINDISTRLYELLKRRNKQLDTNTQLYEKYIVDKRRILNLLTKNEPVPYNELINLSWIEGQIVYESKDIPGQKKKR
jgi:hypothetical protein